MPKSKKRSLKGGKKKTRRGGGLFDWLGLTGQSQVDMVETQAKEAFQRDQSIDSTVGDSYQPEKVDKQFTSRRVGAGALFGGAAVIVVGSLLLSGVIKTH